MKVMFDGELHEDVAVVWPSLAIAEARCECCGAWAGIVFTLSWLWWSVHLSFFKTHSEEGRP